MKKRKSENQIKCAVDKVGVGGGTIVVSGSQQYWVYTINLLFEANKDRSLEYFFLEKSLSQCNVVLKFWNMTENWSFPRKLLKTKTRNSIFWFRFLWLHFFVSFSRSVQTLSFKTNVRMHTYTSGLVSCYKMKAAKLGINVNFGIF